MVVRDNLRTREAIVVQQCPQGQPNRRLLCCTKFGCWVTGVAILGLILRIARRKRKLLALLEEYDGTVDI